MTQRQIICAALVLITLGAFGPALSCQFVGYDDDVYINAHVRAGLTGQSIAWAWTTGQAANYHPLTWMSLMADTQLFGPGPWGYHFTNLLLHAGAAALLFLALEAMTGAAWRSALVAGLFAVHPLRVESVAWVSERKDVLSGFLACATLLAYAHYARRPGVGRYLAVVGLFIAGLLAKPMLVTLPALLLLLDIWPMGRGKAPFTDGPSPGTPPFPKQTWRTLIGEKLPLAAAALASGVITIIVQQRGGALRDFQEAPLGLRLSNLPIAYVRYLGKMVWFPNLMLDYPLPSRWPLGWVAGAAALLAGISIMVARDFRLRPWLGIGWLWYLGMLLPVIGIVQVGNQSMADRYTYLPSIGLMMMAVWSLPEQLFVRRPGKWAPGWAMLVILALLSVGTFRQTVYWHDGVSLFRHALGIEPDDRVAMINLAVALDRRGDVDQEYVYVQEAQKRWPDARTNMNLGHVLLERGQVKAAMPYLVRAVEMAPERAATHNTLGGGYAMEGKVDLAIAQFRQAVALDGELALAHFNLGDALGYQGHYVEALAELEQALVLDGDNADTYFDLGRTLAACGRADQAVPFYIEALRRRPNMAMAYAGIGSALLQMGRPDDAVQYLERALALSPGQPLWRSWLAQAKAAKKPPIPASASALN